MIKKIIVRLAPLFWLIDILILRCGNQKTNTVEEKAPVVLIRLDAIGDFVMWLDSAKEYRKAYADWKLILVCNGVYREIAEHTGLFDEIIPINTKEFLFASRIGYRLKIRRELKQIQASMVVQAVYSRRIYADYAASAIVSPKKVTVRDTSYDNTARWAERMTEPIYTDIIDIPDTAVMEVQKNAEFTRRVTGNDFQSSISELPECPIRDGLIPEEPYFVVFPGGSFQAKMWPVERFARVAEYIHAKTGWKCLLSGAPNERGLADAYVQHYSGEVIDLVGKTSLMESIEVIRHAKFLIGNDTSGIHFAAATDTPSFCVFGGWHFKRFLPYEVDTAAGRALPEVYYHEMKCYNCKIIHRTDECRQHMKDTGLFVCVDKVQAEEVIQALENII